jgi:hypothetical protein
MATDVTTGNQKVSFLRIYAVSIVVTTLILVAVGILSGPSALLVTAILMVLEVTFSFDNAIMNSRLLAQLSPFWQKLFMTVGIFIAVFVVRFALPIFIVHLTAGLGFTDVVDLALKHPDLYAQELSKAGPLIDAFGGTFLVMIGISFLFDPEKDVHWFRWLEGRLAPLGRFDNITIFLMLVGGLVMYFTIPGDAAVKTSVIVAAIAGITLHIGLDLFGAIVEQDDEEDGEVAQSGGSFGKVKTLVGSAAAVMFVRLEALDGSLSFDGVIGAFAITTAVVIIMAGLGGGAMWVRSMTVHLLRAGTLAKYKYLEHGAMWAILALGIVMIAKLYGAEAPEWATGSIGIVFIAGALASSIISQRRETREAAAEAADQKVTSASIA